MMMYSYWQRRLELSRDHYYGDVLPSFQEKGTEQCITLERKGSVVAGEELSEQIYTNVSYVNPADMTRRLQDVVLALQLIDMQEGDAESQEIESIKKAYSQSFDVLVQHAEGEAMPLIAFLDAILDKEGVDCNERLYPQITALFLHVTKHFRLLETPEAERGQVAEKQQIVFRRLDEAALRRMPILEAPLPKTGGECEVFRREFHRQEKALFSGERKLIANEREELDRALQRIERRILQNPLERISRGIRRLEAGKVSKKALTSTIARKGNEIQLKTLYPAVVGILSDSRLKSHLTALLEEYYPFTEKPSNPREVRLALLTKWRDALHATKFKGEDGKIQLKGNITLGVMRGLLMAEVDTLIAGLLIPLSS